MRVNVDIAQRSSNATNEPGCLAISPSAFAFNEEEGAISNSAAAALKPRNEKTGFSAETHFKFMQTET